MPALILTNVVQIQTAPDQSHALITRDDDHKV